MRNTLALGQSDATLEAAWEREAMRELPPEPPMTDDEIEAMYRYFHPEVSDAR